jgi:hypothetical protein
VPATLSGLLALLVYTGELWERRGDDYYDSGVIIVTVAEAAKALRRGSHEAPPTVS